LNKKELKSFVTLLLIVAFPIGGYGEINLNKIYGLREMNDLRKIINETERANPSDKDSLKLLGIAYHNLGVNEVKGAPEKAVRYLERANQLSSDDYEVLAYLGSAKTMIARDSWNVVGKMSGINKGINIMDKAVREAPDNIPIRMVRANNSLKAPKFFNRSRVAKEDFLHIVGLIEKSPSNLDSDTKAEVYYQLGMIFKVAENKALAGEYLKKAVAIAPDSQWGTKAKGEL